MKRLAHGFVALALACLFSAPSYAQVQKAGFIIPEANALTPPQRDVLLFNASSSSITIGSATGTNFQNFVLNGSPANTATIAISGASHTGSDATSDLSIATTLNTSGSPDVFSIKATNTAVGANARLLNLYGGASGATSEFSVDLLGSLRWANSTKLNPGNVDGGNGLIFSYNGTNIFAMGQNSSTGIQVLNTIGLTASVGSSSADAYISRQAAGVVQFGTTSANDAGTIDAAAYKVSGAAGANCTLTTVSHLTVVGGIVTVCN